MMDRFPTRVIEQAVKGMLPRNRLGRQMLRRLKVYAEAEHPHEAQLRAGLGNAKEEPAAPTRAPRRPTAEAAPRAEVHEAEPQAADPSATPARRRTTRSAAPKAPKALEAAKPTPARRRTAAAKDAAESPTPRRRTRRAPASDAAKDEAKPEGE